MDRREMLVLIGRALAIPALAGLGPDELLALARSLHGRAGAPLRMLDPHQDRTVTTVAELIMPAGDTPGATAARVNEFIDLIVAEWYTEDERSRFLRGLSDLDARSESVAGSAFVDAASAAQVAILRGLDAEVAALRAAGEKETAERHFFHRMKYLTMYGYYTSQVGVEQELKYVMVPGRYDPCVATGIGSRGGN